MFNLGIKLNRLMQCPTLINHAIPKIGIFQMKVGFNKCRGNKTATGINFFHSLRQARRLNSSNQTIFNTNFDGSACLIR